jgi:hypothetical protein
MSKYSHVLEQIDNGVRETIRDANDIFDSELYVPLEKMRENPKFSKSRNEDFNEPIMMTEQYVDIKKSAKMSYDSAILKILQKQVEHYKFIDNFKSKSMIDCLHFAKTMFSEDYKLFLKSRIFPNRFLGQNRENGWPHHRSASDFLYNIMTSALQHPQLNTQQVKLDVPYLKKQFTYNRDSIIEIFEIIDLFVNEVGQHKLTVVYLTPINSYNGVINTKFMAEFIQCFISFFEKMNKIEYNPVIPDKSVDHKEIDDFFKSLTKKQKPGGYNKRSMKKKVSK